MLVISRTVEQSFVIGDRVQIAVLQAHGNEIGLEVAAPAVLPIVMLKPGQRPHLADGGPAERIAQVMAELTGPGQTRSQWTRLFLHTDESVSIGDLVQVQFLGLHNGKVRIGITAPQEIPVHRSEVYERARNPKTQSAGDAATLSVPSEGPVSRS
jgi:carbon storage regulator